MAFLKCSISGQVSFLYLSLFLQFLFFWQLQFKNTNFWSGLISFNMNFLLRFKKMFMSISNNYILFFKMLPLLRFYYIHIQASIQYFKNEIDLRLFLIAYIEFMFKAFTVKKLQNLHIFYFFSSCIILSSEQGI